MNFRTQSRSKQRRVESAGESTLPDTTANHAWGGSGRPGVSSRRSACCRGTCPRRTERAARRRPGRLQFVHSLLLWLLVVAPAFAQSAAPRSIRVVMDDNYLPFVFRDSEGKLQGILVDEWRLWESQTGIKADIHAVDWGEALRRMKGGEFDVIDTIFKTREREAYWDFSQPYARLDVPIFFRKAISGISGLKSLKGFPVAVKAGDAAADLLQQNGISPLLLFTNYEAIVQAAREHQVNVFVVDQPPAVYFLQKLGVQDEFRESDPINVGQFHRAVQKGNAALLQTVEAGFAALNPAEVGQIEEKWYGRTIGRHPALRYLGYLAVGGLLLVLGLVVWNLALNRLVSRRMTDLRRINRTLRMITECNQVLVRATDETELLQAVCRLVVEGGGYRMSWVGFAEQDAAKPVRPVARAGFESAYLDTVNITWADTERGQGPTGTCVRTGQPVVARNILTDPAFAPWRQAALERGYAASAALPLTSGDRVLGMLAVYAAEPGTFDAGEVELLAHLADDLAYGVTALRTRAEQQRGEEELRRLSGRLLQAQDVERRRLARELHDTTAQKLAALSLNLHLLKRNLPPAAESAHALCGDCVELTNQAAQEIRTHAYLLHPPLLEVMGLAGAVEDYVQGLSARGGIQVELEVPADFGRLPEDMELALFRVVQESLANAMKHSGSAGVKIRLTRQASLVSLEVQDMGHGISADKLARFKARSGVSGVGLGGMHERLRVLGGRLDLESSSAGTTIRAIVPLAAAPSALASPA